MVWFINEKDKQWIPAFAGMTTKNNQKPSLDFCVFEQEGVYAKLAESVEVTARV